MTETVEEMDSQQITEYVCQRVVAAPAIRPGRLTITGELPDLDRVQAAMERWIRRSLRHKSGVVLGPVKVTLWNDWARDVTKVVASARYYVGVRPNHRETLAQVLEARANPKTVPFPTLGKWKVSDG